MKKLFIITLLFFISCNNKAQDSNKTKILTNAYTNSNDVVFLEKFPNNFKEFKITFGWDDKLDKPNILNKDANDYIDRLFVLVSKSKYKSFKSIIINISIDGKWEADAVGYFQKKLREIIKTDESFVLMLDDLNEKKIMLHKQSKSLTDRKNPDKEIPNEVLTIKDFGNVEFQNYNLK